MSPTLDQVFAHASAVVMWGPPTEDHQVAFVTKNVSALGVSADDLTGGSLPYYSIVNGKDAGRFRRAFSGAMRGREREIVMEYRLVSSDGAERWVEDRTVFHRDAEGRPFAYQASLVDISERKAAQDRLRVSEERLARVLRESRITTWDYLPDDADSADVEQPTSERPEDRLNRLAPRSLPGPMERDLGRLLSGEVESLECDVETSRGGSRSWLVSRAYPVRDDSGRVTRVLGVDVDVTELKRRELAAERQNDRLGLLHSMFLSLVEETDTGRLLGRILDGAMKLGGTEHGRIALLSSDGEHYNVVIGRGMMKALEGEARPAGIGLGGEVLRTRERVIVTDYKKYVKRISDSRLDGCGTVIGLPLFRGEDFFGLLSIVYRDVFPEIGDDLLSDLDQFAGAASIALANARLYETAVHTIVERERAVDLLALKSRLVDAAALASGVLLSGDRGEEALRRALSLLASAVGACRAALFRVLRREDGLVEAGVIGCHVAEGGERRLRGIAVRLAERGPVMSALDGGKEFRGQLSDAVELDLLLSGCGCPECHEAPPAVMAFPVRMRGGLWGFMTMCLPERMFSLADSEVAVLRGAAYSMAASASRWESEGEARAGYRNLRKVFFDVVRTMGKIVGKKDPFTIEHQERVAALAVAMGERMGLDEASREGLRVAGLVHDVGKIEVAGEILNKPGKLSRIEFELVKEHPRSGYEILLGVDFPWPVAEVTYQHHERLDGSGYPRGLKGDAILLESRIIAVADVVEAISAHRPYRPALGLDAAIEEITSKAPLFGHDVVDACLSLLRENPNILL